MKNCKIAKTKALICQCFLCLLIVGCSNDSIKSKATEEVSSSPILKNNQLTVAVNSTIKSAPVILAHKLGFFEKEGIEVALTIKQSGVATKKALDAGQVDIATVPEIIAARASLKNSNLQIISSINRSVTNELVARKNSGIQKIADLRGKKIGIKKKSGSVYWLQRLLIYNSLSMSDVELVDGKPVNLSGMLSSGTVDAIVTWYPHAYNAINDLQDNAYHTSAQLGQEVYWLLLAPRKWLTENPELTVRFLNALDTSNQYIENNPNKAKSILAEFLHIDMASIAFEWPLHSYRIELPQNLLMMMEEEVRFMLDKQGSGTIPNFLEHIYFDALNQTNSAAISIVH